MRLGARVPAALTTHTVMSLGLNADWRIGLIEGLNGKSLNKSAQCISVRKNAQEHVRVPDKL